MKKITVFLVLPCMFLIGLYVSTVYSFTNSAPNFECLTCHVGQMAGATVEVRGLPKHYKPGKTYKLTIVVTSDMESIGDVQGGFALEASAGKLIARDKKNTQLSNSILTHTPEGSHHRTWTFEWRSPTKKEDVHIITMALAANGDFSPVGDIVGVNSYIIKPKK